MDFEKRVANERRVCLGEKFYDDCRQYGWNRAVGNNGSDYLRIVLRKDEWKRALGVADSCQI